MSKVAVNTIADVPLHIFLNKLIKRKFTCVNKFNHDELIIEHMWVKITGTEGCYLKGTLQNTPEHLTPLKFGDEVLVDVNSIERVL